MKKLIFFALLFCVAVGFAQNTKPDFSKLTTLNFVKVRIDGMDLQNNIWQDSIVKIKELKLIGTDAENFKIVYYHFKTNYKKSLTKDEFYSEKVPQPMIDFFNDLEKNCRISFEEIVVEHIENKKQFKIMPLTVLIKI